MSVFPESLRTVRSSASKSKQIESLQMKLYPEVTTFEGPSVDRKPANVLRWVERAMWTGLAITAVVLLLLIGLLALSLFAEDVEVPSSRDYNAELQRKRLLRVKNTRDPKLCSTFKFPCDANNATNTTEDLKKNGQHRNGDVIFDEVDKWLERGSDAQRTAALHRLRDNMSALCARSWQCKLRLATAQYFDAIAFSDRNPNSQREYRAALDVANATATAAWQLSHDRLHRLLTLFAVIEGTIASSSSVATYSEKLNIGIRTFVMHICPMIFLSLFLSNTILY